MPGRLRHLQTPLPGKTVEFVINGRKVVGREGDSLLTAILANHKAVRQSEFGDGLRAGFCFMGACQDCWVELSDGGKVRACTTLLEEGIHVSLPEPKL
ncbi:(2Fe-2S)-binding protein [Fodinicurvata halophila]|uniref:(2Fe-2S)-binding protein n=1 Tax=Fodinicurvata halophila TaxID=1419723 RepID=A0ABV8UJT9_9PROT